MGRFCPVSRMTVAEGSVRTQRKDGSYLNLAFCDVFEMRDARIRKLISYLVELTTSG
jgi:ketosteroid isomerase-like protein